MWLTNKEYITARIVLCDSVNFPAMNNQEEMPQLAHLSSKNYFSLTDLYT